MEVWYGLVWFGSVWSARVESGDLSLYGVWCFPSRCLVWCGALFCLLVSGSNVL